MEQSRDQTATDLGVADEALIREMEQDSDSLWKLQPTLAISTIAGPVLVTAAVLFSVTVSAGWETARRLIVTATVTFFVLGRFVILGGTDAESSTRYFSSGELALMVIYMDVMAAIVISFHAGAFFRIPGAGTRLRDLMESGRAVLADNRWMKRVTFAAIIAFVMFPLASSGSIGGSLFGRLLGLSRVATLAGVVIGSLSGCSVMYFGAALINRFVSPDSLVIRWGGIAFILVLIVILNLRSRKAGRQP